MVSWDADRLLGRTLLLSGIRDAPQHSYRCRGTTYRAGVGSNEVRRQKADQFCSHSGGAIRWVRPEWAERRYGTQLRA